MKTIITIIKTGEKKITYSEAEYYNYLSTLSKSGFDLSNDIKVSTMD